MKPTELKFKKLKEILQEIGSGIVLYSGGVDSTFLLKVGRNQLKDKVVALTTTSLTYSDYELSQAKKLASDIGIRHLIVDSNKLEISGFSDNSPNRCYYCKRDLIQICLEKAREIGLTFVMEGSNYGDLQDHRPGIRPVRELGARTH